MYCLLLHLLSSKKHTYKVSYEIKCGNWKTGITKRYKKRPVFVMNLKLKVKIVINSFPEKFSIMYMIVKTLWKVNNIITFFFSFFYMYIWYPYNMIFECNLDHVGDLLCLILYMFTLTECNTMFLSFTLDLSSSVLVISIFSNKIIWMDFPYCLAWGIFVDSYCNSILQF